MKHFMCVHHFNSKKDLESVRKSSAEKPMTDREVLKQFDGEKAKAIQHWAGSSDFFYCHWLSESEEALHEAFEEYGITESIYTMVMEAPRFASNYIIEDRLLPPFTESGNG